MSNGIKYFVTFTLGAAAGSVAAWYFLKSKYEQLAREEIEEVRDYYRQKDTEQESKDENPDSCEESDEIVYRNLVNTHYGDHDQEGGSEVELDDIPRVISPEEFAENSDEYQTESLTLYACGTLTDDFDNPIKDIPAMVGDALDHFGDYDDDVVHVKNDMHKCNYEICKDIRTYDQVRNRILNLVEDDE